MSESSKTRLRGVEVTAGGTTTLIWVDCEPPNYIPTFKDVGPAIAAYNARHPEAPIKTAPSVAYTVTDHFSRRPEDREGEIARPGRLSDAAILAAELRDLSGVLPDAAAEIERLHGLIYSPHIEEFLGSVKLEAVHQRERWGEAHARGKQPEDWLFLIGSLAGKACAAQRAGNRDEALHHAISTAAVAYHWHTAMTGAFVGEPAPEPKSDLEQDPSDIEAWDPEALDRQARAAAAKRDGGVADVHHL